MGKRQQSARWRQQRRAKTRNWLARRVHITVDRRIFLVGGRPHYRAAVNFLATAEPEDFAKLSEGPPRAFGLAEVAEVNVPWLRAAAAAVDANPLLTRRRAELLARSTSSGDQDHSGGQWLDSSQTSRLRQLLERSSTTEDAPLGRLARWVYWLGGARAVERFLTAAAPIHDSSYPWVLRALDKFVATLDTLERQALAGFGDFEKQCSAKYREAVYRLPNWMCSDLHPCDERAAKTLRSGRHRADALRESLARQFSHHAPARLAALAATDGGRENLPAAQYEDEIADGLFSDFEYVCDALADQARKPAYDEMLAYLADRGRVRVCDYQGLRRLLARGESADLVARFAADASFEQAGRLRVRLSKAMEFERRVRRLGLGWFDEESIYQQLSRPGRKKPLAAVLRWFEVCDLAKQSPQIRHTATRVLNEELLPAMLAPNLRRALAAWPQSLDSKRQRRGDERIPRVFHRWMRGLAFFQRRLGEPERPPKRLREQLQRDASLRRQLSYLDQQVAAGEASPAQTEQARRLAERLGQPDRRQAASWMRDLREANLQAGLAALRQLIARETRVYLERVFGPLPPHMHPTRQARFMAWLEEMPVPARRLLDQILDAYSRSGPGYRACFPENRKWLSRAGQAGVRRDAWLRPEVETLTLDGASHIIEVAQQPLEIFLMGDYYKSCLSPDGCNGLSVLTNAADANKQVVYLRDASGRPVARQLIAINQQYELLGYHVFQLREEHAGHAGAVAALAAFAGRLARRCGLRLGKEGKPESTTGHFWYDDGVCAWDPAAEQAFSGASPPPRRISSRAANVPALV